MYEDVDEDSVGLEEEDEDEGADDAETGFEQAVAWNAYLNLMLPFPNPNKQWPSQTTVYKFYSQGYLGFCQITYN